MQTPPNRRLLGPRQHRSRSCRPASSLWWSAHRQEQPSWRVRWVAPLSKVKELPLQTLEDRPERAPAATPAATHCALPECCNQVPPLRHQVHVPDAKIRVSAQERRLLRPSTRPEAVLCKAALSLQLRASCSSGPTLRRRPQLAPLCRNSELTPLPPPEGMRKEHLERLGVPFQQTIWNSQGLARRSEKLHALCRSARCITRRADKTLAKGVPCVLLAACPCASMPVSGCVPLCLWIRGRERRREREHSQAVVPQHSRVSHINFNSIWNSISIMFSQPCTSSVFSRVRVQCMQPLMI